MENTTAMPIERRPEQQTERRKENKLIAFKDRRAGEYHRAADRAERQGEPVKAALFQHLAYLTEQEGKI